MENRTWVAPRVVELAGAGMAMNGSNQTLPESDFSSQQAAYYFFSP